MVFIGWLFFSFLVAFFASGRGRSYVGWLLFSLLLSPLLAGIALLLVGSNKPRVESEQVRSGAARKCPACAELIRIEARKCKHCGSDVEPAIAASADDRAQSTYGG